MSTLELVIWYVLGYSAIPVILMTGAFLSSVAYFALLELTGRSRDE